MAISFLFVILYKFALMQKPPNFTHTYTAYIYTQNKNEGQRMKTLECGEDSRWEPKLKTF